MISKWLKTFRILLSIAFETFKSHKEVKEKDRIFLQFLFIFKFLKLSEI